MVFKCLTKKKHCEDILSANLQTSYSKREHHIQCLRLAPSHWITEIEQYAFNTTQSHKIDEEYDECLHMLTQLADSNVYAERSQRFIIRHSVKL